MINILCRRKRNKYPTWGVRPQGWNSKELTGARTSSGVCGLIRSNAKNLTRSWHRVTNLEISFSYGTRRQVVHGCRQLVSWDVGLSPATSATPIVSCQHVKVGTLARLPVINRRKVGMTSNHHALYVLGYTRTTMAITKRSEAVKWSKTQKSSLSSDWRLKFAFMKPELLVMAGQHTAVNTFPGLVHTARHTMRVGNTRSLWANKRGSSRR